MKLFSGKSMKWCRRSLGHSGIGLSIRDLAPQTSLCGIDAPQNPTWLSSDLSVSDRLERKQRLHDLSP
jgi:hypothetical protein